MRVPSYSVKQLKFNKMKKFNVTLVFISVFFLCGVMQAEAKQIEGNQTPCQIEETDVTYEGQEYQKAWNLTYGNDNVPLVVLKCQEKGCTSYYVRCEYFDVHYAVDKNGFGARKLKNSMAIVPFEMTIAVIDQDKIKSQKVITRDQVDDEKALGLIGSFLPELLNENYKHLLS